MPLIVRLAMVFAGGAAAGNYLIGFTALVVTCAAACMPLLIFARGREGVLMISLAATGIGLGALRASEERRECAHAADGAPVQLTGYLESTPTEDRRTVSIRTFASSPHPKLASSLCRRTVRVRMPDDSHALEMGDAVSVAGTWMALRIGEAGPGPGDGLVLAATVSRPAGLDSHGLLRMRGRAQQRIRELFPVAYPLAEALLIAQRENLNPDVRESFAASGLTHLLAISGTHVALVAASLLLIARLLRASHAVAALASVVGSAAYVFFLGAPYAALRALIQMLLVLGSRSLQRPAHPLGLLAAAAFAITALDPAAPLDAGFQLSFAGICGIVLWRRPLSDLMPASLPTPVRDAIATTVAATAATTPIAAFHFGVVSVISLAANLLAIPVVSIAVPTAAAALALSGFSMALARFIAAGAELPLLWLAHIAETCARVPGGHFSVTPVSLVVATAAVIFAFRALRDRFRSTLPGRGAVALLAGSLPVVIAPLLPLARPRLEIHMIDVGQGDAFAIRSPRGRWILVDAGPVSERFDAGKRNVVPFLLRHQAARLEAVVLTHPHLDHFGGLPAITQRLQVTAVIDPMLAVPSAPFDSLLALAQAMRIPWLAARPGSSVEVDGVSLEFISPAHAPVDGSVDPNDYSAVFRLRYGRFSALFLGDLPAGEERRLVHEFGTAIDVDLLKVAHHGSNGSSTTELLVAASPQVALISAGRRNRYGHPGARVVSQLETAGVHVFRTDRDGTVSIAVSAGGGMRVSLAQ